MSPSCRSSTKSNASSRRRILPKNKHPRNSQNQENSDVSPVKLFPALPKDNSSENSESKIDIMSCNDIGTVCLTPKAKRYRIPEIKTCPPPPKKKRIVTSTSICSSRKKPMTFFAPPDIDVFFYFALRGIQV